MTTWIKPFSMRELNARIKALLRRVRLIREEVESSAQESAQPKLLTFNDLVIDMTRREVRLGNDVLQLKPKNTNCCCIWGSTKGQVLTREVILEHVWGWDFVGDSRTVDVHIRWLREKIEQNPESPPIRIADMLLQPEKFRKLYPILEKAGFKP